MIEWINRHALGVTDVEGRRDSTGHRGARGFEAKSAEMITTCGLPAPPRARQEILGLEVRPVFVERQTS